MPMIVQSIYNSWYMVQDQYRKTEYRTLMDPITHKTVIEMVHYFYNKVGQVEPTDVKGLHIDIKT